MDDLVPGQKVFICCGWAAGWQDWVPAILAGRDPGSELWLVTVEGRDYPGTFWRTAIRTEAEHARMLLLT